MKTPTDITLDQLAIRIARLLGAVESGKTLLCSSDGEDEYINISLLSQLVRYGTGLPDYVEWSDELQTALCEAYVAGSKGGLNDDLADEHQPIADGFIT
jgi:hypothetical protein